MGSGGGLPGLVLAEIWPAAEVVLVDATRRRCEFLEDSVRMQGWEGRVRVVHQRAEIVGRSPHHRSHHALVVARSFGPPAVLAECAAPMLDLGGLLVVSEPPDPDPSGPSANPGWGFETGATAVPGRWPEEPLSTLGLRSVGVFRGPTGRWQVLRQMHPCPDRYPRRVGIPAKRPLYRTSRASGGTSDGADRPVPGFT